MSRVRKYVTFWFTVGGRVEYRENVMLSDSIGIYREEKARRYKFHNGQSDWNGIVNETLMNMGEFAYLNMGMASGIAVKKGIKKLGK